MGEVTEEVTQVLQGEDLPSAKQKPGSRDKSNSPMEQTAHRAAPCPPQLIGVPLCQMAPRRTGRSNAEPC